MLDWIPCETCGAEITEDDADRYWGQCEFCFFAQAEEAEDYRYGYAPEDDWLGD